MLTKTLALTAAALAALTCSNSEANMNNTLASESNSATVVAPAPAAPDAQMQAVLDELAALGGKPFHTLTAAEARKQPTPADAVKALLRKQGKSTALEPGVRATDRTIPGPKGPLPVRVYTPESGNGPFPVLVYYHGGGWVIANKEVYDAGPRSISKLANAVVVSVDYRQGPEHRFPAAHDDAYAAYDWVLKNAASIQGDPARVAVGGESAGGGLAVSTSLMAREKGIKLPVYQMVIYPIAGTDTDTPSYNENADAKPLGRAGMEWFFENYLSSDADRRDPRVNLVSADLKGMPATIIINAQIDPLRSEGEALAERLRAAGVAVDQRTFPGTAHEFFGMAAVIDKAKEAQQMAANGLKAAFSR